jgi:signal transduction histidine kinase
LIADLLDLSRIISGNARVEMTAENLVIVLREVIQSIRPVALERQVDLKSLIKEDDGDIPILGDKPRLAQIFSNLLNNAIKFTPAGGRIDAQIEKDDQSVSVVISDTGVGIAADFLPHVFDSYSQANPEARTPRGLGLGLAICKHLVGLHGGKIFAASAGVGRGACFTVRLPLLVEASAQSASSQPETSVFSSPGEDVAAENQLTGLGIVVVDDNADARLDRKEKPTKSFAQLAQSPTTHPSGIR